MISTPFSHIFLPSQVFSVSKYVCTRLHHMSIDFLIWSSRHARLKFSLVKLEIMFSGTLRLAIEHSSKKLHSDETKGPIDRRGYITRKQTRKSTPESGSLRFIDNAANHDTRSSCSGFFHPPLRTSVANPFHLLWCETNLALSLRFNSSSCFS